MESKEYQKHFYGFANKNSNGILVDLRDKDL